MIKFVDILRNTDILARYRKVRKYFYLKESSYDVTSKCQLRCDGCYYFQGDKYTMRDVSSTDMWRQFFQAERARGITYAVLAGAEPSLAPSVLQACFESIKLGMTASNGLRPIDPAIRYRIHLSVWGDAANDSIYRKYVNGRPGPNFLSKQLQNYKYDDRVVFVYTFNGFNTNQVDQVVSDISAEGHKVTFNVFSAPEAYKLSKQFADQLPRIRDKMLNLIQKFPEAVLYSDYNAQVHTDLKSLDEQFGCVYPRAAAQHGGAARGIGQTFRSYRTDLTHAVKTDCCVPDTDCQQCRHYAAGSAIVSARMEAHVESETKFRAWLDYVDTYLSVWVLGYSKGVNLYRAEC